MKRCGLLEAFNEIAYLEKLRVTLQPFAKQGRISKYNDITNA